MDTPRALAEIYAQLTKPFDLADLDLKPGATSRDKAKALALPYADARVYQERLDAVVGPGGWQVEYRPFSESAVFCRLTIWGVSREDVGECHDDKDENRSCIAVAQAFKRACTAFGLGRYLYSLPQVWGEFDAQKKQFTDPEKLKVEIYKRAGLLGQGPHPTPPRPASPLPPRGPLPPSAPARGSAPALSSGPQGFSPADSHALDAAQEVVGRAGDWLSRDEPETPARAFARAVLGAASPGALARLDQDLSLAVREGTMGEGEAKKMSKLLTAARDLLRLGAWTPAAHPAPRPAAEEVRQPARPFRVVPAPSREPGADDDVLDGDEDPFPAEVAAPLAPASPVGGEGHTGAGAGSGPRPGGTGRAAGTPDPSAGAPDPAGRGPAAPGDPGDAAGVALAPAPPSAPRSPVGAVPRRSEGAPLRPRFGARPARPLSWAEVLDLQATLARRAAGDEAGGMEVVIQVLAGVGGRAEVAKVRGDIEGLLRGDAARRAAHQICDQAEAHFAEEEGRAK